jgi:hypothetical protein
MRKTVSLLVAVLVATAIFGTTASALMKVYVGVNQELSEPRFAVYRSNLDGSDVERLFWGPGYPSFSTIYGMDVDPDSGTLFVIASGVGIKAIDPDGNTLYGIPHGFLAYQGSTPFVASQGVLCWVSSSMTVATCYYDGSGYQEFDISVEPEWVDALGAQNLDILSIGAVAVYDGVINAVEPVSWSSIKVMYRD